MRIWLVVSSLLVNLLGLLFKQNKENCSFATCSYEVMIFTDVSQFGIKGVLCLLLPGAGSAAPNRNGVV